MALPRWPALGVFALLWLCMCRQLCGLDVEMEFDELFKDVADGAVSSRVAESVQTTSQVEPLRRATLRQRLRRTGIGHARPGTQTMVAASDRLPSRARTHARSTDTTAAARQQLEAMPPESDYKKAIRRKEDGPHGERVQEPDSLISQLAEEATSRKKRIPLGQWLVIVVLYIHG